jgi:phage-related protein
MRIIMDGGRATGAEERYSFYLSHSAVRKGKTPKGARTEAELVQGVYGIQKERRNWPTSREVYFVWLADAMLTARRCCR